MSTGTAQESDRTTLLLRRAPLLLAMCFPLVPHHYALVEFSVRVVCEPLAFSPIAIAFAFALVSSSRVRHSALPRLGPKLLLASALLLVGCDIAYVAWRLGHDIQIPMTSLQPLDVLAQSLLLTTCAFYLSISLPRMTSLATRARKPATRPSRSSLEHFFPGRSAYSVLRFKAQSPGK